jgi:hypothetical protein
LRAWSDQCARYAVAAIGSLDEKILQKNHRPAPAGDGPLAEGRHADKTAPGFGFGDQGGKARLRTKRIAQPIGRGRAHGMQAAFTLRQQPLEAHQRRHVSRPRRAHAKRQLRHAVTLTLLPGWPMTTGGVGALAFCVWALLIDGCLRRFVWPSESSGDCVASRALAAERLLTDMV